MLVPQPVPNQALQLPSLKARGIKVFVKRLDLVHPIANGNKFYKLKYNLLAAREAHKRTLLTFGGAYSNHIHATAAAANAFGFQSIGVIRGEKPKVLNPTLVAAEKMGMHFHFMDRTTYRLKADPETIHQLTQKYGDFYLIPEGGTNRLAIKGTGEILTSEDKKMDIIACSVGTGGTMAGIVHSAAPFQTVFGFSSLKGEFIKKEIHELISNHQLNTNGKQEIVTDYHFGGYAKFTQELIDFIKEFKATTGIPLDPVYTGKLFFGVFDKINQGAFPEGTSLLLIHSGGLQGVKGFNERFNENLHNH